MLGYLATFLHTATDEYLRVLWVLPILTLLELALPASRCSWTSRLRGAVFWVLYIPAAAAFLSVLSWTARSLGWQPLLHLVWPVGTASPVINWLLTITGAVVSWAIGDFFFYWYHRAEHAWFWRIHRVHHAIRELSATNGINHISDELIRVVFMQLPLTVLITLDYRAGPILLLLQAIHGQFLHSPTRFNLGPLRRIINDNAAHRIHHSIEPRHRDKNFGGTTLIWDQVFGTAYFPKPGEWPETGVEDFDDPETIKDWLLGPLKPLGAPQISRTPLATR